MSSEDKTLVDITMRHHQDAIWFDSGLHDANGYVAMAHKDRGELLAKLRMLRTGEGVASPAKIMERREFRAWMVDNGFSDLLAAVPPKPQPQPEIIWGGGYGGGDEMTYQSAQARYSAALRSLVDTMNRTSFDIIVNNPRPWWRRVLDRIAA